MKNISRLIVGLVALAAAGLSSCVTSGDLARVEQAQFSYQSAQLSALQELRADTITPDQYEERTESALESLQREIGETIEAVERRTEAIASAAGQLPTDPGSLLTYLLGLGGTVASSVMATNAVRDKRRLKGTDVRPAPPPG